MSPKIALPLAGEQRHRRPRVVGIDLGTTNSLVAVMEGGRARVLRDPEAGSTLLPSIVYFPPDGPPLVGAAARSHLIQHPDRTVYSVKRMMGRGLDELADERARSTLRLSGDHREVVRICIDDRQYSPPEVSACILRALRRRAESTLEEEVTQAVITVPAYFNDGQRQATRDAGRIAGLEVLRILNEPTAACLAYGLDRRRDGIMAVYDLGGGTFDISILKLRDGIFEVQATNGDTHLGGDDFDGVLADELCRRLLAERSGGTDSAGIAPELRLAAEEAKRKLTDEEAAEVRIDLPDGPWCTVLSRGDLEALVTPLVDRTLGPCLRAMADAGVRPGEIDEVVLVGGSTRMPLVRRAVAECFEREPLCELNPDEVVAIGAAVQAGILAGEVDGLLLLDVNPLSLGIETYGGAVERLIPRNSTIPTSARNVFSTSVEGQSAVAVHVVQGERELAADCRSLARFNIHIPPMPAGWPRLEITFLVDENGILTVTAYEHRSRSEARVEVRPANGLTEDEVERMVVDSFAHAGSDVTSRRLVEARVEGEQVAAATRKQLPDAERLLTSGELTQDEVSRIRVQLRELEAVLPGGDAEAIHRRIEELDHVTRKLAALVIERAVRHVLEGKSLADADLAIAERATVDGD